MVKVLHSDAQPQLLDALLALFETKWPDFESTLTNERFPSPLLLLAAPNRLVGGLSFTTALLPDRATEAVWINAVMVLPEFQRKGFASELIDLGCATANAFGTDRLFVYTDVPNLYIKLGWQKVTSDKGGQVFSKVLGCAQ
jgi:predicted N-acetyltransferase YhbS